MARLVPAQVRAGSRIPTRRRDPTAGPGGLPPGTRTTDVTERYAPRTFGRPIPVTIIPTRPPKPSDPTCPAGMKWHRPSNQCIPATLEPFLPPDTDPQPCPPGFTRQVASDGSVGCVAPPLPDRPRKPTPDPKPKQPRPTIPGKPLPFTPTAPPGVPTMPLPRSPLGPTGPVGLPSFPGVPSGGGFGFDPRLPFGIPGNASDVCRFLPGDLRRICEAATGGGGGNGQPLQPQQQACPAGTVRIPGTNQCVSPGDAFPGGDPFTFGAGGVATMGSFGLPAVSPTLEQRVYRDCPRGMVLGTDNLCYPRQILSRRSQFRKWKGAPRPPITAGDMKAIRRAARAKDRVAQLGKDVGLHVSKSKSRPRARGRGRDSKGRYR